MPTRFGLTRDGRRIEIEPDHWLKGDRLRLFVDGDEVADVKASHPQATVGADGVEVTAKLAWHGGEVRSAELAVDGGRPVALEPAPGSRAARRERFAREHPGLYAARHVARGAGRVILPLIGIGLLIRLLPSISIPLPDLPSIPWPDLPGIPLPDLPDLPALPGWIQAILESAKYWGPIVVGIALAVREYRKRRRRAAGDQTSATGEERPGGDHDAAPTAPPA